MFTSHKHIVQTFFDLLNQRDLDCIDDYFSDDFAYIFETYIHIGSYLRYEGGKTII